jgi:transcriptional regulator with XRE-family HTH domain
MESPILDVMPAPPPRRDDLVRERIRRWIQSSGVTQTAVATLIGKPQPWISRYLGGELDADFETLERLARVFGHSLTALFDSPADPAEARVIDLYRALPEKSRLLAIQLLEDWTHHKRGGRNRK